MKAKTWLSAGIGSLVLLVSLGFAAASEAGDFMEQNNVVPEELGETVGLEDAGDDGLETAPPPRIIVPPGRIGPGDGWYTFMK